MDGIYFLKSTLSTPFDQLDRILNTMYFVRLSRLIRIVFILIMLKDWYKIINF